MLRNTERCRFAALETAKAQAETRLQSALAERDAAVQARQAAEASANLLQQQLQVRITASLLDSCHPKLMLEETNARHSTSPATLNAVQLSRQH